MTDLQVLVWGSTRAQRDGIEVPLRPKERAVLAAVVFDQPRPVPAERIAELVWGVHPPLTARKAVHNHVARIRRVAPDLVTSTDQGYALASQVGVDLRQLEALATGTRPVRADAISSVLTGVPYEDLAPTPEVAARQARARGTQATLVDLAIRGELEAGHGHRAVLLAERFVDADPYREERWWLLAAGLVRTGRRRDALQTLARARDALRTKGLEPGAELARLERLIADDDPSLFGDAILRGATGADPTGAIGLDEVLTAVDRAMDGGRTVAVVGAPGSGKTTLAHAVATRHGSSTVAVYRTACEVEPSAPLAPVADLVEQLVSRQVGLLEVLPDAGALALLSPRLAATVRPPAGVVDRHRLLDAIEEVFRAVAGPTLVIVDDVHWAPPLTAQALARAAATTGGHLTMLLTTRPDELPAGIRPDVTVSMPPWSVTDVETSLAGYEPEGGRRRAAARWLREQTGGNPMFVRELTLMLVEQEALGPGARGSFHPPDRVPAAIASALAARVARLSRAGTAALEAAAVLGPTAAAATLRRMLGERSAGLEEAAAAGLLVPDEGAGTVTFEHALLHRVALDRLGPAALAELHDLALTAREPPGAIPDLAVALDRARHAIGAAAIDPRRAVTEAIAAGRVAAATYARAEAADLWLTAAELLDAAGERTESLRWSIDAGRELLHAGDPRATDVLFRSAHAALDAGEVALAAQAATVVCRIGPTSVAGALDEPATTLYRAVLPRVDDPGRRAALAAAATIVHSMSGETELCRSLFEQALADAATDGRDETWVEVLPYAYQSLAGPADLDRRIRLTDHLAESASRIGRADARWSALHLRFSNQVQQGDPGLRSTLVELEEVRPLVAELSRDWEMHYVRATTAHIDGDLALSEAIITDSLAFTDSIAASRVMAVYGVQLLAIRHAEGRLAEMAGVVATLAAEQPAVGAWWAALALAAAHAGDHETARVAFDRAAGPNALAVDQTYTAAVLALGEAAVALDDPRRAATARHLLAPWAGRWSWAGTCTLGPIDWTLAGLAAVLGEEDAARHHATTAVAAAERLGAPVFTSWARERAAGI